MYMEYYRNRDTSVFQTLILLQFQYNENHPQKGLN